MDFTYQRVVLKISGEALSGAQKTGIDFEFVTKLANILKKIHEKDIQIGIVVGGGNFWRGRTSGHMNRVKADHMGMLATVMNGIALTDCLDEVGVKNALMTTIGFPQIGELYSPERAIKHLENNEIVVFGYGTGSAFFSTDTAASLRASEIGADIILKATTIDGVYTSDPKIDSTAQKYKTLSFDEMLNKNLKVIDSTAASMCRDNKIPVKIFSINPVENILNMFNNSSDFSEIGTLIF